MPKTESIIRFVKKIIAILSKFEYTINTISLKNLTAGISRPLTETVISGRISALSETVKREYFAIQRVVNVKERSPLTS
jgi:hypothetical protein